MRINKNSKWETIFKAQYDHFEYQEIPFKFFNKLINF